MPKTSSERLFEKVKPYNSSPLGPSVTDIGRMPLTADVVEDISKCLRETDVSELKMGLWFAQGVLDSNPPRDLLLLLLAELPKWINHEKNDIREMALPLLVRLREGF